MNVLTRHPLSALFSRSDLKPEDLKTLADDIKDQGLLAPITLLDGQILDGWNRYQACEIAEVKPSFVDLAPDLDPWDFVKALNMFRRHMTPAERVAVMLLHAQMRGVPNGTHEECPKSDTPSVREIQKDIEVGRGTANRAQKIAKVNDPVLNEALADKRVSLNRAAEIADLPEPERKAAIQAPRTKPEAAPKPPPVDDQVGRIAELEAQLKAKDTEIANLKEQLSGLADSLRDAQEDNDSMARIVSTDDRLTHMMAELGKFKEQARLNRARVNGLLDETNDLKRMAKSWMRKCQRLEKATKDAGAMPPPEFFPEEEPDPFTEAS